MRHLFAAGLPVAAASLLAGAAAAQEPGSRDSAPIVNESARVELTGDPWSDMDYGPFKVHSYIVEDGNNANKGIAIRVDDGPGGVAKGSEFLLFDTDTLRWAAGWTGSGFMNWNSINYNGRHVVEPAIVGDLVFTNPDAPGWSRAGDDFRDTRLVGRAGGASGRRPVPSRAGSGTTCTGTRSCCTTASPPRMCWSSARRKAATSSAEP